ncbi:hypothetical protein AB0B45_16930 [Nonomuraea sp. NPDC049152]|uniref:hypothetical protein n=1 Tax=Nonomuraea sp. NPDC049152 TaxID=3154350 RepID=UPI0033E180AE
MPPDTDITKSSFEPPARALELEQVDLKDDVDALHRNITFIGDFAGDDDRGRKFRRDYDKYAAEALGYIAALRDAYPEIAKRLRRIPTGIEAADWASIKSLPEVPAPPTLKK